VIPAFHFGVRIDFTTFEGFLTTKITKYTKIFFISFNKNLFLFIRVFRVFRG